jgi:hypothetical protein
VSNPARVGTWGDVGGRPEVPPYDVDARPILQGKNPRKLVSRKAINDPYLRAGFTSFDVQAGEGELSMLEARARRG